MTPPSATRFRAKLEKRSDADTSPADWGGGTDATCLSRREDVALGGPPRRRLAARRSLRRSEGRIALQGRQRLVGEQAHRLLRLVVRQVAEGEFGDHVVHAGHAVQLGDL